MPKCPKCENEYFRVVDIKPQGAKIEMDAVICTKCNTLISVLDTTFINNKLTNIEKKLEKAGL